MSPRCFLALPLADESRRKLQSVREELLMFAPEWSEEKWVRPENLHVTLRFIGDVDAEGLPCLLAALTDALAEAKAVTLVNPRLRAIPEPSSARMIWVALEDTHGTYAELVSSVVRALRDVEILTDPSARAPVPHITLCRARARRPIDPNVLRVARDTLQTGSIPMSYPVATLFSSRLAPTGPTYETVAIWPLRGERPDRT